MLFHPPETPARSNANLSAGPLPWAVLLLTAGVLAAHRPVSFDLFWYLRAGDEILARHALPTRDPFSYTSFQPWINHEWLAEVLLALIHRAAGMAGLVLWQCLSVVAALVLVLPQRWRLAVTWRGWVGVAGAGAALAIAAEPRAQLFSWILLAATLRLCLDDIDRPSPRLFLAWPIEILWTNLHGGNPTGLALVGLLLLARPSWRRVWVALGSTILTLANPYGILVHNHFLGAHSSLPEIREWHSLAQALALHSVSTGVAFLVGLLAVLSLLLPGNWRQRFREQERFRFWTLALLLFALVAALYARFALDLALLAAAFLARVSPPSDAAWAPSLASRLVGPVAGLCLMLAAHLMSPSHLGFFPERGRFPEGAVAFLRQHHPPGPMLNSYNFGGYLQWAYPDEKVFIDGRAFTVYSESHFRQLLRLYDEPTFFRELERHWHFRLAVLQRAGRGANFLFWLRQQPGWHVVYEDAVATILVAASPSGTATRPTGQ